MVLSVLGLNTVVQYILKNTFILAFSTHVMNPVAAVGEGTYSFLFVVLAYRKSLSDLEKME